MLSIDTIKKILDKARWAPSGDNTQPWTFEIVNEEHIIIHGLDTRDTCVYDLDGHPTQISIGTLLETMKIAASAFHVSMDYTRQLDKPDNEPTLDIYFTYDNNLKPDLLVPFIEERSVQRRMYKTKKLSQSDKLALKEAVGNDYHIIWLESWACRWETTLLMWCNAKLRLVMPEAYIMHKKVIHWNTQFSEDRLPDQSLGLNKLNLMITQIMMKDWKRLSFANKYLGGTILPRIGLDFLPSISSGAHVAIVSKNPVTNTDDYIKAGQAVQRFWLTVTSLQLQMQPEVSPLVFARYIREKRVFSPGLENHATQVKNMLDELLGRKNATNTVFMARLGYSKKAKSRSIRKPLHKLLKE